MTGPDRPPSILSDHGEGYCRACRFVVALDRHGMIAFHSRGVGLDAYQPSGKVCPGGGKPPPKVTPYASRKSAFRVRVPLAKCATCGLSVEVLNGTTLEWHSIFRYSGEKCPGSGKRVKV